MGGRDLRARRSRCPGRLAESPQRRRRATHPVLQLADFALPSDRGDFGGGALDRMGPRNLFVSLFEHGPESVGTALFASSGHPWPVAAAAFGPNRLQRPLPGQAGAQWFFTATSAAFCLYAVVGSYTLRVLLPAASTTSLSTHISRR